MNYQDLIREDYKEQVVEFYLNQFINKEERSYYEFPAVRKDGTQFWAGQNVNFIYDEEDHKTIVGFQAVVRDITATKNQEQKIKEQNILLEEQNVEIKNTLSQLMRAKVSRKASYIVLGIAIVLFILSEAVIDPIIDNYSDSQLYSLLGKGVIALLLKPVDFIVERQMLKRAVSQASGGKVTLST